MIAKLFFEIACFIKMSHADNSNDFSDEEVEDYDEKKFRWYIWLIIILLVVIGIVMCWGSWKHAINYLSRAEFLFGPVYVHEMPRISPAHVSPRGSPHHSPHLSPRSRQSTLMDGCNLYSGTSVMHKCSYCAGTCELSPRGPLDIGDSAKSPQASGVRRVETVEEFYLNSNKFPL